MKKSSKSFIEILFVSLPKVLNGLSLILLNSIIIRYLGTESFGIYSICIFSVLILDATIGSAFDLGILRLVPLYQESEPEYAISLQKSAIYLKLFLFVLIGLVVLLFIKPIGLKLFHTDLYNHLIGFSLLAGLALLMLRSSQVNLQVNRKFKLYGGLDLLQLTLRIGGIGLLLLFFKSNITYIIIIYAAGIIVTFLISLTVTGKDLFARSISRTKAFKELFKYVKWFIITTSLGAFISRLDVYLLGIFSSLDQVGIFSGGFTYALVPELIGSYLAVVFGPRIMKYYQDGIFYPFFKKIQLSITGLAVVIYLGALLIMPLIGPLLLPESFSRSQQIFYILLPGSLANMILFPLTLSFLLFVKPYFWVTMEAVTLPVLILMYIIFIRSHGAIGAAYVTVVSKLLKNIIGQIYAFYQAKEVPQLTLLKT